MAAASYDFTGDNRLEQGSTMTKVFIYRDAAGALVDLTGYDAQLQARANVRSPTVLLDLTVANAGFVIDGPAGKLTMVLSEEVADTMTWLRAIYAIELVPPAGQRFRFIEGEIEVSPDPVHTP